MSPLLITLADRKSNRSRISLAEDAPLRCFGLRGRVSLLFLSGLIVDGLKFEFAGRQVAQR